MDLYPRRRSPLRSRWAGAAAAVLLLVLLSVAVVQAQPELAARYLPDTVLDWLEPWIGAGEGAEEPVASADHLAAGLAHFREGHLDDALDAFRRASEIDPENAAAHAQLGYTLALRRRYGEAVEAAKRAVSLDPTSAQAHAALAFALDWNGQYDEAIVSALRALELDPQSAEALAYLAEAYADVKRWDEALENAERAISLAPGDFRGHYHLGYVYETMGQYAAAVESYQRAADRAPKLGFIYVQIAINQRALSAFDEAVANLEKAIQVDGGDPVAYEILGRLYYDQEELERAESYFEQAVQVDPGYASGFGWLGVANYRRRRYEEAIQNLVRATELYEALYPGLEARVGLIPQRVAEYYYLLGWAHVFFGECDLGVPAFDRAVRLDPSAQPAWEGLEQCAAEASQSS